MNQFTLENDFFSLKINSLGAELKSAFHKKMQKEILYDGKTSFWNRTSPVLFPIVGKLKYDEYSYNSKQYVLTQHGFARDQEFELVSQTEKELIFSLKSSEKSHKKYPFNFELKISYTLLENEVFVAYKVKNNGEEILPFSIGAHPGFVCPVNDTENFEDYYLEFEQDETFNRHLLDLSTGNFNGKTELVSSEKKGLDLHYSDFEKDAIVFKSLNSNKITLKSRKSDFCLEFNFNDFPYFGIWTKANANFICLEPWCGLADSIDSSGDILEKEGIILLESTMEFERAYSFKV